MDQAATSGVRRARETDLQTALGRLCRRHGLAALYVFGSRAEQVAKLVRGDNGADGHPGSDVDVGVLPAPKQDLDVRARVRLAQALEDLFGVHRVDLIILPEADPFLATNVIRGERLYAQEPHAADEYELYVLRRAGDLAPLERQRIALILGEAQ